MIAALVRLHRAIGPEWRAAFAIVGLIVMVSLRWCLLSAMEVSVCAEISGWVLLIIVSAAVWQLDDRFRELVRRLDQREVVLLEGVNLETVENRISRRADLWEAIGSIVLPVGLVAAYLFVYSSRWDTLNWTFVPKIALEFGAAFLFGGRGGRLVAYGFLGRWLRNHGARIRLHAGHPDGTGGLKIVGSYYLYQAGLVMIPVVFLGFWWVMAPIWPQPDPETVRSCGEPFLHDFTEWRVPFFLAFTGFILVEFAVFLLPMTFFHWEMVRHKKEFDAEIDEMGREVVRLKELAFTEMDSEKSKSNEARCQALKSRIEVLEALPNWPIDTKIRRRFAWQNLALILIPPILKVVFHEDAVADIFKALFG